MNHLNQVFTPSKAEIWQQFCSEISNEIVHCQVWQGERVVVKEQQWTISLDTYNRRLSTKKGILNYTYTRIRAPYLNQDNFQFTIYRKGVYSDLGKFFGMENIQSDDPWLDQNFIIQSNSQAKVKELLKNPRIYELMSSYQSINLPTGADEGWFGTCFPEGLDELYLQIHGIIKDIDRLKCLFELFAQTLNYLCQMNSYDSISPKFVLDAIERNSWP